MRLDDPILAQEDDAKEQKELNGWIDHVRVCDRVIEALVGLLDGVPVKHDEIIKRIGKETWMSYHNFSFKNATLEFEDDDASDASDSNDQADELEFVPRNPTTNCKSGVM
jgi:hypothetical protein